MRARLAFLQNAGVASLFLMIFTIPVIDLLAGYLLRWSARHIPSDLRQRREDVTLCLPRQSVEAAQLFSLRAGRGAGARAKG